MSYRHGRQSAACPEDHHDVTAQVAVDSLAARVGAGTRRQRSALLGLGVTPPISHETRARLVKHFAPYNDRMAAWLGQNLSPWNVA